MKIIVAITGASGSLYAKILLNELQHIEKNIDNVAVVFSKSGLEVWNYELGNDELRQIPFRIYSPNDFNAPFASGSSDYTTMVVCPCSMGSLGRIAHGISDDLITRAADVMLKERRKLVLVPREMPYNLIHINNLKTITEAGAIVCPASPSFYSKPQTINELAKTVVNRVLSLIGYDIDSYKWGEK